MIVNAKINSLLLDGKKIESFDHLRRLLPENVGLRYVLDKKILHLQTDNKSMTKVEMIETKFSPRKKLLFRKESRNPSAKVNCFVYYSHGIIECLHYNPYNILAQSLIIGANDERFSWDGKKAYENVFYRGNKIDDFSPIFSEMEKFENMPKLILYEEDDSLKIDFNYIDTHIFAPIFAKSENDGDGTLTEDISIEKKLVSIFVVPGGRQFQTDRTFYTRGSKYSNVSRHKIIIFRGNKKIDILYVGVMMKEFVDEDKLKLIDGEELEIVKKIIG